MGPARRFQRRAVFCFSGNTKYENLVKPIRWFPSPGNPRKSKRLALNDGIVTEIAVSDSILHRTKNYARAVK
jgi:N-acyl-D-aspartate/D-glutamate deacylase